MIRTKSKYESFDDMDNANKKSGMKFRTQLDKTCYLIKKEEEKLELVRYLRSEFLRSANIVSRFDKQRTIRLGIEINKIADELPSKLKVISKNIKKTASLM